MAEGKQVVTVFGATGAQGGSVVGELLRSGKYAVRGVTRSPSSDVAQRLYRKGVEVVGADMGNSHEVRNAVCGAYAVFSVTDFYRIGLKEFEYGSNVAQIAKEEGVQHFVWSTLANAEKISGGKYKVPHFTNKAKVDEVVVNLGFPYFTFYEAAFYYQNFQSFDLAHTHDDGTVSFDLPLRPHDYLTGFDVYDTGAAVLNALENPNNWGKGQRITMAANHAPMSEWIDVFQRITGKKAILNTTEKAYSEEWTEQFSWFRHFTYYGDHDLKTGWEANPNMKTWEQWLPLSPWMA